MIDRYELILSLGIKFMFAMSTKLLKMKEMLLGRHIPTRSKSTMI